MILVCNRQRRILEDAASGMELRRSQHPIERAHRQRCGVYRDGRKA
jgi:hypothetical protein